MKAFRSMPRPLPYPDGRTWHLERGVTCWLPIPVRVPQGFETDFASVPRAFWALLPPWDVYGPAAIVHDWLYWIQDRARAEADRILLDLMIALDVPRWKRCAIYSAVRIFGGFAWRSNAKIAGEGYSRIRGFGAPLARAWKR